MHPSSASSMLALCMCWRAMCAGAAQDSLSTAFFPKPTEVTPDYWQYTQWRSAHRLFSAVLHNFSTQAWSPLAGAAAMTCGTMGGMRSGHGMAVVCSMVSP